MTFTAELYDVKSRARYGKDGERLIEHTIILRTDTLEPEQVMQLRELMEQSAVQVACTA